jgi:hypothetical protein
VATKSDFSEAEWEDLQKGATGAAMLVAVSDRGFFDSFKEAGALAKHLTQQRDQSSSALIRELAAIRGTGFGLTTSPAEIESETLEALRLAARLLKQKAPDELDAYREFVMGLAQSVATAAAGGDEAERSVIEKISSAFDSANASAAQ